MSYWAGSNIHFLDRIVDVPARLAGGSTREQLAGYFTPDWSYLFFSTVAGTSRPIWGNGSSPCAWLWSPPSSAA